MDAFWTTYWPHLVSAVSGLIAIWTLVSRLHASFVKHFGDEFAQRFASREQVDRIETKVNTLVQLAWSTHRNLHATEATPISQPKGPN
jgi:hypothetical protein